MSAIAQATAIAQSALASIQQGPSHYASAAASINTFVDSLGATDQAEAAIGGDALDCLVGAANALADPDDANLADDLAEDGRTFVEHVTAYLEEVVELA